MKQEKKGFGSESLRELKEEQMKRIVGGVPFELEPDGLITGSDPK